LFSRPRKTSKEISMKIPSSHLSATIILCLAGSLVFLWPARAFGDNVGTLDFSASYVCATPATCGTQSGTATGTWVFDFDTDTIYGPWSFDTPLGVLSSSTPGASDGLIGSQYLGLPSGYDLFDFQQPADPVTPWPLLLLNITLPHPQDSGEIIPNLPYQNVLSGVLPSALAVCDTDGRCPEVFQFTSGSATLESGNLAGLRGTSTPAPEPASIFLLGSGLVAFAPLLRRRFA
jgi:hypothetical protein